MKRAVKVIVKLAVAAAVVAAVAHFVRDRLVPAPEAALPAPPRFRVAPAPEPPAAPPSGDDLSAIHGVGPVYRERLADAGISRFADLAGRDPVALAAEIGIGEDQARSWVEQAGDLAS